MKNVICKYQKVSQNPQAADGVDETSAGPSQAKGGALFTESAWAKSKFAVLLWVTRWTTSGLMPVRPQLLISQDITLASGTALKMT